jgi:CubicO group peptidase (beta-lactamase class C family)
MKKIKIIVIFFVSLNLTIFSLNTYSQENTFSKNVFIHEVDSILTLVKSKWKVPGLAIGIVKDGEVILKKGYGYRDVESQSPVTTETLFSTGSSTKSFTATGIGILVNQGKISWEDRVQQFLPDFALKDSLWADQATITDILSHRTGLPAHNMMQFAIAEQYGREGIVNRIKYLDLSEPFRAVPQYQNQMYQVATVLIEKISGKSWEDFTKEEIFKPLEMNASTFSGSNQLLNASNIATRYEYTSERDFMPARPLGRMIREISGSGSIVSNIDDMCNWLQFNINQGVFLDGKNAIQEEMQRILDPYIPISKSIGNTILMHSFALGWDVLAYRGRLLYDKPGGYMGVTSQVVFLPEEKIGIVLFANLRSQVAYWIITAEILDRLLGLEPLPYIEEYWSQEESYIDRIVENLQPLPKPDKTIESTIPIDNMTGGYRNDGYGDLTVNVTNGELRLNYVEDTVMAHYNKNTFQSFQLFKYWKFEFITNPEGNVTGISIPFEPRVNNIVFKKIHD